MNRAKVQAAKGEAERFIERCDDYLNDPPQYEFAVSKVGGAVRRASMDLTRALADLRRPL